MAITLIGLHSAEKRNGETPTGQKTFILESDTQITDDIDQILDFTDLPAYDETWNATDPDNLRVRQKRATTMDEQEGFIWMVETNYEVPTGTDGQDALDPRDRPWDWSITPDKREIVAPSSLYTATQNYPNSVAGNNKKLTKGDAIQNTAGLPFSDGVLRTISRIAISLTKYVSSPNGYTELGLGSWQEFDQLQDSVNDNTGNIAILGTTYTTHQLLMDEVNRAPVSENGFDVIKVNLRIIVDTIFTHEAFFPSQGFKELDLDNNLIPIYDAAGDPTSEPRLLNITGNAIPLTGALIDPVYVVAGLNEEKDWTSLTLPATIP